MEGELENNSIVGIIENTSKIIGSLDNENNLQGTVNPITVQSAKNYNILKNKPKINEVELIENKNLEDLNVTRLTNSEIENIINSIII